MGLDLDFMFHPRSIAVVGASQDATKRGYGYVDALLHHGYKGPIYVINPRGQDVLGLKGYRSLLEVPGPVDYVISSIPATVVLQLVDESAKKGVKVIHFFTARFSETGHAEGIQLERDLLRKAKGANIRVLGPNCMGIYYPAGGLSFMRFSKEKGGVGILSQSGGNVSEIVFLANLRGVHFSKAVSFGNAFDINESDLVEYFTEDPETEVIAAYVEGVRDGPRFIRAIRAATERKPVIVLKGGNTEAGTRAVASHTASLAGSRRIWEAAASQTNAVLVDSLEELVDMLVAFRFGKPVYGTRVGVIGGGGGRSVEAADTCERAGLKVQPVPPSVREEFKKRSPNFWDWISNPVDGSILRGSGLDERAILQLLAASPEYDFFITNVREMWTADSPEDIQNIRSSLDGYLDVSKNIGKTLFLVENDMVTNFSWQNEAMAANRRKSIQEGVATFPSIHRAARALSRLSTYYRNRKAR